MHSQLIWQACMYITKYIATICDELCHLAGSEAFQALHKLKEDGTSTGIHKS